MDQKDKEFLKWLANRLVFKHGYSQNDPILERLNEVSSSNFKIDEDDLDKIISKYYTGFFLDKTEDYDIGYTDKERESIRTSVKLLVSDILNKNVPSQIIR